MTQLQMQGHIVVVMGPMGAGKGTILKEVLTRYPQVHLAVSCTTRAMRPQEVDGREYHFITREHFKKKIDAGDFLEWAEFSGNLYGTLKSEVVGRMESGEVVILEIELQGVEQLRSLVPSESLTVVFVESGGWEVLKARALERAPMSEEELAMRFERYEIESASKPYADVIINNIDGDRAHAAEQMSVIIEKLFTTRAA